MHIYILRTNKFGRAFDYLPICCFFSLSLKLIYYAYAQILNTRVKVGELLISDHISIYFHFSLILLSSSQQQQKQQNAYAMSSATYTTTISLRASKERNYGSIFELFIISLSFSLSLTSSYYFVRRSERERLVIRE